MAKKKSSDLGVLLVLLVAGMGWFLSNYGKEILIVCGIGLAIWIAYKIIRPKSQNTVVPSPETYSAQPLPESPPIRQFSSRSEQPTDTSGNQSQQNRNTVVSSLKTHNMQQVPEPRPIHRGPSRSKQPTSTNGDEFWQKSDSVGIQLGCWIYYGSRLSAVNRSGVEPALVDPDLPVDQGIQDCTVRRFSYWPTYCGASPEARSAYQYWLKTGRKDPSADIGYVFLYFYGLERRILHDTQTSQDARNELPSLQAEIERLLSIYTSSGSFQGYAGSLLDLLKYKSIALRTYEGTPPPLRGERELTFEHRVALGQCSADGNPLPAEWAFTWLISSPTTHLRTPAKRCPEEFRHLFVHRYGEEFGEGMLLPKNRTLLKVEYRSASPTFGNGSPEREVKLELPDVTVLSRPMKELQELAEMCCSELDAYSRFIGKNPELVGAFDAMVELPFVLWSPEVRKPIEETKVMADQEGKPLSITFQKLRGWLPKWQLVNKQKMKSLHRALGEVGLGMEPDVRFGGGIPSESSTIVMFADDAESVASAPTPGYSAAVLTLQLAAAVAGADGHSSVIEIETLSRQLENWLHLSESERRRLHARLRLMLAEPPKLTGLKARIEQMDLGQREAIGEFLALIALADESVVPEEIKALEKTFSLLGLDPESVYSAVHVAATEPVTIRSADEAPSGHPIPAQPGSVPGAALKLNPAKVAALQADSERVAALLRTIFEQPAPELEVSTAAVESEVAPTQEARLLDLDTECSLLVRTLLSRARWTRAELEDLAEDRDFMLDGTLEKINDAAFSILDKPLFEGEDPIEINPDAAREVLQ